MFKITRTRRGWFALATMLALALVSACSGNDPDRADTVSVSTDDDQAEAEETARQVDEQISDPSGEAEQADASEPADEPPAEPVATVEGQPPFASLEITDLRRVGDTVTLEFVIVGADGMGSTNPVDIVAAPQDRWDGGDQPTDERRQSVSGVTLVDQVNRKRHLVLRDSEGACLCTRFAEFIDASARYPHSAQFPAPPEDVTQMTVQVPTFPAVDSVPLRVAN
jgi:hypothetical protein